MKKRNKIFLVTGIFILGVFLFFFFALTSGPSEQTVYQKARDLLSERVLMQYGNYPIFLESYGYTVTSDGNWAWRVGGYCRIYEDYSPVGYFWMTHNYSIVVLYDGNHWLIESYNIA